MSKPENIFLVRHGQSRGNVDRTVYRHTPDYAVQLTDEGYHQANAVGSVISKLIPNTTVQFYVSPFWRTRQTFIQIQKHFKGFNYYEDPRLREQEWGQNMDSPEGYRENVEKYRDGYGHFYYRFRHGGESCADVFDRMSDFLDTMYRDFDKKHYPDNTVIVTHGMTMRVFLMRFFHCNVEEFESWANPKNCEFFHMKLCHASGKYSLVSPLRQHIVKHSFQFNWESTGLENLGIAKLETTSH
jgi:broad specificity phosphatase PhoE